MISAANVMTESNRGSPSFASISFAAATIQASTGAGPRCSGDDVFVLSNMSR